MSEVSVTHKGWFLLCPVYFGQLDSPVPIVEPRWARLGVSLRTPALRESVNRRFPERPFSVGVDLGGKDRTVVVQLHGGRIRKAQG